MIFSTYNMDNMFWSCQSRVNEEANYSVKLYDIAASGKRSKAQRLWNHYYNWRDIIPADNVNVMTVLL